MSQKIQSIRGMKDLMGEDMRIWQHVESVICEVARLHGYLEIRLPLLERTQLFKRSIGDATDIVEKEMYTFLDNSGESITLRPEATASCVRAGIQHGMFHNAQTRLWYMGPMFRYERPQKGRYRQFHQFGIEAFGWTGPDIDIEIIEVGKSLWQRLGIEGNAKLQLNTLGTRESRIQYREQLVAYFSKNKDQLDDDSIRRLGVNPLRILDSKNPKMHDLIRSAPVMRDFLSDDSQRHFIELIEGIEALGIQYEINDRLVRGLDYYTGTVFEWVTDLLGAQNAICAGGRYDGLVTALGGPDIPGAGFALGIERLVEVIQQAQTTAMADATDIYICLIDNAPVDIGVKWARAFRSENISVTMHCGGGKLARQMRCANREDARISIIVGESEIASDTVTVKNMRSGETKQHVAAADAVATVQRILNET